MVKNLLSIDEINKLRTTGDIIKMQKITGISIRQIKYILSKKYSNSKNARILRKAFTEYFQLLVNLKKEIN